MNRDELRAAVDRALVEVREALMNLEALRSSPAWDEDYKVEREPRLSVDAFIVIQSIAEDLSDAVDIFGEKEVDVGEALGGLPEGMDGFVLAGLALASHLGSGVAHDALGAAAFRMTTEALKRTERFCSDCFEFDGKDSAPAMPGSNWCEKHTGSTWATKRAELIRERERR